MPHDTARPVLVYDGDCPLFHAWADFWRSVTGDSVEYLTMQQAVTRFPRIAAEKREAVEFITPQGRFGGAEGICRLLTYAPGYRRFFWCYRHVPGFAALTSLLFRFAERHRNAARRVTCALWGEHFSHSTWIIASEWFCRALAIVYAIAFFSFGLQARGLIGADGILPVSEFLNVVYHQLGAVAIWRLPTLFWLSSVDSTLLAVTWGCMLLALASLLMKPFGRWHRVIFIVLWACYLSIVNAGQAFMSFQWDWLLVETGFIAIFLRPVRSRVWMFRWLLFRLLFESGAAKLFSPDAAWRNLTALNFHYETQPLPTPLAWYMHLAPDWFQSTSVVVVLAIEVLVSFLIFGPRRLKQIAGTGIIAYQILIMLTGNYGFFNLLTIALCLFLFDDRFFERLKLRAAPAVARAPNRFVTAGVWALIVLLSAVDLGSIAGTLPLSVRTATRQIAQFGLVNHYGLFAVVPTQRMEIQIQGSMDGKTWEPFLFSYQPGPPNRRPPWVEPLQPRVDWQMWFAGLTTPRENPWLVRMVVALMRGSKPVAGLLERTPFQSTPPRYMRAIISEYHFTTWDENQLSGNYWKSETKGLYLPTIGLPPGK